MSEAGDLLMNKSMDFAVRIVNLYKWLCSEQKEYIMSKQLPVAALALEQIFQKLSLLSAKQTLLLKFTFL